MSTCHDAPPLQSSLVAHSPFARVLPPLPRRSLGTPCALVSPSRGLPRYYGESASALIFSRPARCSLLVAARALPDPPGGPFLEVLQRICRLLHRSEWFRRELGRRAGLSPAGKVHLGKAHTTTLWKETSGESLSEGKITTEAAASEAPKSPRSFTASSRQPDTTASPSTCTYARPLSMPCGIRVHRCCRTSWLDWWGRSESVQKISSSA